MDYDYDLISREDRAVVLALFSSGAPTSKIYAQTGFGESIVRTIILDMVDNYATNPASDQLQTPVVYKRKTEKQLVDETLSLFDTGCSIAQIVDITRELTISEVEQILVDNDRIPITAEHQKTFNVNDIQKFAATVQVGDIFAVRHEEGDYYSSRYTFIPVTIEGKYPNIVMTDKGSYTYVDLFLGKKLA